MNSLAMGSKKQKPKHYLEPLLNCFENGVFIIQYTTPYFLSCL